MTVAARGSWSLRRRLVVGIVGLLAVVSVVVGVSSVVALRQTLMARLDEQVMDAASRAAGPLQGAPQAEGDQPGNRIGTLVLRTRDGVVVRAEYVTESGVDVELTDAQIAQLRALDLGQQPMTVDLGELGEFRVGARELPGRDDVAIAGLPTAEVTATTSNLALIFALVTLAALVVAALAGTQVVRVALRPLDRVTATARRVAELPLARGQVALAERVPDSDPRTEVGQVGAAFNRMLEHVESSLRARQDSEEKVRQFVADASHELRTPLASIRGYSELTRRSGLELPDDIVYALARIESESVRMTSLVEELLLLARLDAGQELAHGTVDLVPLIADAVSDAHAASPEHDWRIETGEDPLVVTGDANRLHQVVANLLANARVHTPAGTVVTVSLVRAGDDAVLTVADDGPGIPAALRPVLFERFARGDGSRSRGTGSTGLGLAIVAAVVEAHRGSVALESDSAGARFVVRLPLARPEQ
ncbi:sensor histidine kinase [Pseudolysinimonas yzui]|uniref:histidine kinase n=1 Tax=Pseudolysinimonas yzui TaxID=2708254 RepID=A0A8J3M0I7_9MICO|nr:HAMP domain-containing sensor histidine kinase [Pseudolysinimonas yzui]GHF14109.1 sensor histidine kinase [Pseudolysinimonas yzui]